LTKCCDNNFALACWLCNRRSLPTVRKHEDLHI